MNHPGTIRPSRSINVDQATLCDLFNALVERKVDDRLHDVIVTAIEETFVDTIQLETEFVASQNRSIHHGIVDISIPRVTESRYLGSYLKASVSNLADSTAAVDTIFCTITTQKSFISLVASS